MLLQLINNLLSSYGLTGLVMAILIATIALLYRSNIKLHDTIESIHKLRVEETKDYAEKQLEMMNRMEVAATSLSITMKTLKDLVHRGRQRD